MIRRLDLPERMTPEAWTLLVEYPKKVITLRSGDRDQWKRLTQRLGDELLIDVKSDAWELARRGLDTKPQRPDGRAGQSNTYMPEFERRLTDGVSLIKPQTRRDRIVLGGITEEARVLKRYAKARNGVDVALSTIKNNIREKFTESRDMKR